jgi:hypothetical protein
MGEGIISARKNLVKGIVNTKIDALVNHRNSAGAFDKRDEFLNPTTLLNQAPLAFAFFCATERRGGCAVVSPLSGGGRPQASRFLGARPPPARSSAGIP